ncbi:hypothetical protein [Qipengyuania oceanensis]|uniref:Uncharacterized protein n=1 Tax=Qipengyuania oceanensis TaxID=1463597 RepID=A0A844YFR4_9SPHN|nr:hypothetical protein [Qipengyuania oceanensis]MXO64026.1 hypothetical protein [Qipengyuania oceanensis]
MMLANMRNDWGVGGDLLRNLFYHSPDRRLAACGDDFVDINPFLCPTTDLLPENGKRLRAVHMVREPGDWMILITNYPLSSTYPDVVRETVDLVSKMLTLRRPLWLDALDLLERANSSHSNRRLDQDVNERIRGELASTHGY